MQNCENIYENRNISKTWGSHFGWENWTGISYTMEWSWVQSRFCNWTHDLFTAQKIPVWFFLILPAQMWPSGFLFFISINILTVLHNFLIIIFLKSISYDHGNVVKGRVSLTCKAMAHSPKLQLNTQPMLTSPDVEYSAQDGLTQGPPQLNTQLQMSSPDSLGSLILNSGWAHPHWSLIVN